MRVTSSDWDHEFSEGICQAIGYSVYLLRLELGCNVGAIDM